MRNPAPFGSGEVLLCLPDQRALAILSQVLTSAGFSVTSTRDVVELEEALPFGGYVGILTVAALMGPITARSDLPLVDIFPFSRGWLDSQARPDLLDGEAVLKRVRILQEHRVRRLTSAA